MFQSGAPYSMRRRGAWMNILDRQVYLDGIHDDSGAINEALLDLSAMGGGGLFLPAARYGIANPILIPSYCWLIGEDRPGIETAGKTGTCLNWVAGLTGPMIQNQNYAAGGVASGDIGFGVKGIAIVGGGLNQPNAGISFRGTSLKPITQFVVEDCQVNWVGGIGIDVEQAEICWIRRNRTDNTGASFANNPTVEACALEINGVTDSFITENDVTSAMLVANVGHNVGFGIHVNGAGYNYIAGNNAFLSSTGIEVYSTKGNRLIGNRANTNLFPGIVVQAIAPYNALVGNHCVNNGQYNPNAYDGIQLDYADAIALGNVCFDDQTPTKTQRYGISLTANATRATVIGNHVQGNRTGGISATGAALNAIIALNNGYNPVGLLATPFDNTNNYIGILGSSGTVTASKTYTNHGIRIKIYVSGGTAVAVSINGASVPYATAGSFYDLEPNDTITFGAFSGAPTVIVLGA